jgi:hypothetical protein
MSTSIPSGGLTVTSWTSRLIDAPFVARKLNDAEIGRYREMGIPAAPTEARADPPAAASYATVQKDGRTIATLYRGGGLLTASDIAPPEDLAKGEAGTALADQRIRQMLALHGGTVVYARDVQARNAAAQAASLFTAQLAGQASA